MEPFRRYTAGDIRTILQRAARRQSQASKAMDSVSSSLTLSDIERAAREAGIEPRHVREAAADLESPDDDSVVRTSRSLSFPPSDEIWRAIVDELRDAYQTPGSTGQIGSTREWTAHDSHSQPVHATFYEKDGATTLSLSQHYESLGQAARIGSTTIFTITALLGLLYLLGDFGVGVVYLLATFFVMSAIVFAAGPKLEAWMHRRTRDSIASTLDRLELVALRHTPEKERAARATMSTEEAIRKNNRSADRDDKPEQATRRRRTH